MYEKLIEVPVDKDHKGGTNNGAEKIKWQDIVGSIGRDIGCDHYELDFVSFSDSKIKFYFKCVPIQV